MTQALFITAVALAVTGCAAQAPLPDPLGYVVVRRVEACGTPVAGDKFRYKNVVLGDELSSMLVGMLKTRSIGSPLCWLERSDGVLSLDAGPLCNTTVSARFRKLDNEWRLESEDVNPIVMCHERAR